MTGEDDGAAAARAGGGSLGALLSPLSAAVACRAAASAATSTAPAPSDASPPDRRGSREPHPLHGAVARGVVLPGARSRHRRNRSRIERAAKERRRQTRGGGRGEISPGDSPTAIALKKRASTLPTSFHSPQSVLDAFDFEEQFDAPRASANGAASNSDAASGKGGFAMKKTRSEGAARRNARSYNPNVPEDDADAERTVGLKPSRVSISHRRETRGKATSAGSRARSPFRHSDRQEARGGTGAHPGRLSPPPSRSTYPGILPPTPIRHEVQPEQRTNVNPQTSVMAPPLSQRTATAGKSPKMTKPPKKKSSPVDVDNVPRGFHLNDIVHSRLFVRRSAPAREASRLSIPSPEKARPSGCRSAPTGLEFEEVERARRDAERLLNQMGMDVAEGDGRPGGSYDCNYHHPLERAYEDFGVERLLVERKESPGGDSDDAKRRPRGAWSSARTARGLLRRSLAGDLDDRSDGGGSNGPRGRGSPTRRVQPPHREFTTKVLSFLRGKGAKPRREPARIVATNDGGEVELTLGELRLMHRWRTARGGVRCGAPGGFDHGAPLATTRCGAEDLSMASSSGDKTLPVDNRRRRFGSGCSI